MEKFKITGGTVLRGEIEVGGAKNAVLPILAACLLASGEVVISGVPRLTDVKVMQQLLEHLGVTVKTEGHTVVTKADVIKSTEVPDSLMRKMRASNLVMGPLLARCGHFKVSYPGGCAIGSRPIDLHLKGLKALGAKITEKHGYLEAEAAELRGAEMHLDFPSVGATENLMMAAALAKGTTVIHNAAKEPEIVDLQNFLAKLGAKIKGAGTDVIVIDGTVRLGAAKHQVIPDRIEAGTHLVAAAITKGNVLVKNVIPQHIEAVIAKLREAGFEIREAQHGLVLTPRCTIKAVDLRTLPYPGFPTDMQPQMTALMTIAEGSSVITETVFENRFKHADELRRMGAKIRVEGHVAVIKGVKRLSGSIVEATDLRAGAALVLAGMAAENTTVVENIEHIDRGYEELEKKYQALGAKIIRFKEENNGKA